MMTATLDDVSARKRKAEPTAEEAAAADLVRRAREQGLSLTGPGGLLKQPSSNAIAKVGARNDRRHPHCPRRRLDLSTTPGRTPVAAVAVTGDRGQARSRQP
jgi:hypothetical protein